MQTHAGEAVHRAPIELPPDIEAGDAFRLIALSCLRHLTLNEPALAAGDVAGVHQMRVATRRLRAAISLFKFLFEDRESEPVKAGLRWLTEQLGPVRDYDVWLKRSASASLKFPSDAAAFAQLTSVLRQRRSQKLAQAQSAVQSERYRELILHTTRWILSGAWANDRRRRLQRRRRQRLVSSSRRLLERRRKRVQKQLERLSQLAPERRHELRIAIKKLHYGAQFFASLFPARPGRDKKFFRLLGRLQAGLGELNDARVHRELARELLAPMEESSGSSPGVPGAFALGLLQGADHAEQDQLVRRAKRDGRKLARQTPFWH